MQVPPRLIGIIALLWSVLDLASPAGIQASRPAAPTGTSDSMIHPVTPDKLLSLDKYLIRYEDIPLPNFGLINDIIRDDRGFLWVATTRGLFKYDGYQVKEYPNGYEPIRNRDNITKILRMDDGSPLLSTGKGLWRFDLKTELFDSFLPEAEFSEVRVRSIVNDSNGTIWIGTESHGLFGYNQRTKAVRRYTTGKGLSDDRITALLADRSGTLWIGTLGGGLNCLDPATSTIVSYRAAGREDRRLLSDHVTSLCEAENRDIWIGTDNGLNVLEPASRQIRRVSLPSPIRHTIWSMARDPAGSLWIAASDLGLLNYRGEVLTRFPASGELARSLSKIRALYFDPVATGKANLLLWIGTRSGVTKLLVSSNPFANHLRNQDSLQLDRGAVLSFCRDRTGILWLGLWGGGLEGLRRVDGRYRRISHFEHDSGDPLSLPSNDIGSLAEDRNGNLWIGTSRGLGMLDHRRKQMIIDRHVEGDSTSLSGDEINEIHEDRNGAVWFCTKGGLSRLLPGGMHRFENFLDDPGDARQTGGNTVSGIVEDRLSNSWVATYGRGLNKIDSSGKITRYLCPADSPGVGENRIDQIAEDPDGLLWLSTRAGLVSFDPRSGVYGRFPIEDLRDGHIFGISIDRDGDLWLSTAIGLGRFSPKSREFERFDEQNGLQFKEFFSAFYRDDAGRLLAGGSDGFMEFSPADVPDHPPAPVIVITSVSVFDSALPASVLNSSEVRLSHDQNFFSFTFAALDYSNPRRNRFAYKMEGIDEKWVDAGTRNFTSYANLDPGGYIFRVKGCNSSNVWNEAGASISIMITPPYWRTWWFRILVAALFGCALYTAYRYRLGRLLAVERLRLRIADDLHDDVGSNLSAIAMVSRVLQRTPDLTEATKLKLAEIYDTAVTTSEGMRDIVWFIKPGNDTLEDLFLRLKEIASSLLADIDYELHAPAGGSSVRTTLEFKRNFFLAFKEILTNVAKHASATRVEIHIEQRDGVLEVVVWDNGRGFSPLSPADPAWKPAGNAGRGNGLGNLRSRALTIGGNFEISSERGKGTTAKLWGKL